MLKKTIEYTDFNGDKQSEDFYFHLSKAELVELETGGEGGSLHDELEAMTKNQDGNKIIQTMKKLILASYGKRSEDGRRFIKNQEIRDEFESSEAYSVFFMDLLTNAEAAAKFTTGVIPPELAAEAAEAIEKADSAKITPLVAVEPERIINPDGIKDLSPDERAVLNSKLASGEWKLAD